MCETVTVHASLPDVAIVVRGGVQRDAAVLFEQVLDNQDMLGIPVLSVYALTPGEGESGDETILRICETTPVKHGQIQTTTVGALRELGLEVRRDTSGGQAYTHCHVIFRDSVEQSDVQRFVNSLSGPTLKPKRLHQGG